MLYTYAKLSTNLKLKFLYHVNFFYNDWVYVYTIKLKSNRICLSIDNF